MYKIAVLGDAQSVQGFAALGLQVCPAAVAHGGDPPFSEGRRHFLTSVFLM